MLGQFSILIRINLLTTLTPAAGLTSRWTDRSMTCRGSEWRPPVQVARIAKPAKADRCRNVRLDREGIHGPANYELRRQRPLHIWSARRTLRPVAVLSGSRPVQVARIAKPAEADKCRNVRLDREGIHGPANLNVIGNARTPVARAPGSDCVGSADPTYNCTVHRAVAHRSGRRSLQSWVRGGGLGWGKWGTITQVAARARSGVVRNRCSWGRKAWSGPVGTSVRLWHTHCPISIVANAWLCRSPRPRQPDIASVGAASPALKAGKRPGLREPFIGGA